MNKLYLFILPHNYVQKKKERNTVQNESGREALNRNLSERAYNIRLPQLNQLTHSIIKLLSDCNVLFPYSLGVLSVRCSSLSACFGIILQFNTRFNLKIFTRRFILNFLCLVALIILKKWHLQYQFSGRSGLA